MKHGHGYEIHEQHDADDLVNFGKLGHEYNMDMTNIIDLCFCMCPYT